MFRINEECQGNVSSASLLAKELRFLLAKFQLDYVLSYREPRKRMKALEMVPKDMSSAYNDVLQRIEKSRQGDKDLAMKILSWLFRAQRTLFMSELIEALVVENGDQDLERDSMLQPSDIIECCKSLVIHDESSGLVRFAHYTVQQFIAEKIEHNLLSSIDLAKTCLTYLSFIEFKSPCLDRASMIHRTDSYRFGRYAIKFWAAHVKGQAETLTQIQADIFRLFGSESTRNSILQTESFYTWNWFDEGYVKDRTLLHIVAKWGILTTCHLALDTRLNLNAL